MLSGIASRNGEIVPASQATLPLDSIELAYGYGVYESLKVRKRILFFPDEHMARLARSAEAIGLPLPADEATLRRWLAELAARVEGDSFNVKMLLVGRGEASDLFIFASAPHYVPEKAYRDGVAVISWNAERPFPQAKTLAMLPSFLAYREAKRAGAHDALLVDREGNVPEGTRSNLFFVHGGTLCTPPASDVLEGVTRATLIAALAAQGIAVEERKASLELLKGCEGCMLTSTSAKALPVSSIDGTRVPIPALVREAVRVYDAWLEEWAARRGRLSRATIQASTSPHSRASP